MAEERMAFIGPITGASLTLEIKNSKPVELADLTRSFLGFTDEFSHYIEANEPEAVAGEVKLYVKQIKSGSIVADLVAISPQLMQMMAYTNAVISFGGHLKRAYDFLTGKTDEKPDLDGVSYQNLSSIVEPIAKDRGAQLNISTVNVNAPVYINLDSTGANAAQNTARKQLESLKEPESRLHEKVLLYWYQARADATSKAGDRGIIESISKNPVKVVCATDKIKSEMILEDVNPFKEAYVVDVMVETIKGKPALYKVLAVHDKFEREDV